MRIEILGDHIRDEDEKLERRDADRPSLKPKVDLNRSQLLALNILAKPPEVAPTPSTLSESQRTAKDLYGRFKPSYSNRILSLSTKI
jgi:hypothetical protein